MLFDYIETCLNWTNFFVQNKQVLGYNSRDFLLIDFIQSLVYKYKILFYSGFGV